MNKPAAFPEDAPASLQKRIRTEIEAKILSGEWGPGYRIPFEHELTVQYGCSRMTVSKAISALAEAGLVVRRRRAGSFVARPKVHSAVLDIPDLRSEIEGRGEAYAFKLVSCTPRAPKAKNVEEIELARGGDLLALRGVHFANGRPFAIEDRLISLTAAPLARNADFAAHPPGAWLLEHIPWTEAENRISAMGADNDSANLLAIAPGTACLAVERRTWRGGEGVTKVRQLFPGEAYDLVARFGPSRG
ncbi:histidine utilization repressor [Phenylobacterium sp.]|uniref:histidine utilization repressor n=1 Tax=Phenylobacterium sp. TaxID=1871053 RepID=UPI002730866E|nr:histidine utilization repressor [Phenylobacterium sp.]MDP1598864.1 histidine utilization repressor [Phenylobacterium sp.]MDP3594137.1 histidine utilization repressor [Phenylobacterium sp.]